MIIGVPPAVFPEVGLGEGIEVEASGGGMIPRSRKRRCSSAR